MSSGDTMAETIRDHEIEHVIVEFPDIDGISRSKRVDAEYFLSTHGDGISMNMLLLAVSSMTDVPEGSGYGESINFADGVVVPVPETFVRLPWDQKTASVICDFEFRDEPAGAYTRHVLNRVLTRVNSELDVEFGVGNELEFHLLRDDGERYAPATNHKHECVTRATGQADAFYDRLKRWCEALDIPVQSIQHEYGAGQFEVLFEHASPMAGADRTFRFRETVKEAAATGETHKEAAATEDYTATFMAKPFTDEAANGYHLHLSAFDGAENRFEDDGKLSEMGRHFVGGILEHIEGLTALCCPTLNAFKRFTPGSFSPYTVSWGYNNRTAAVRIPESTPIRIEQRLPSADANPYLVIAGTLAAGMHGVREEIDPGEPVNGDAAGKRPPLPRSQEIVLRALEDDDVLVETLGSEFVRAFTAVKRREHQLFNDHVTDWEKRYLEVL